MGNANATSLSKSRQGSATDFTHSAFSSAAQPLGDLQALQELYEITSKDIPSGGYGVVQVATLRAASCQARAVRVVKSHRGLDADSCEDGNFCEALAMQSEAAFLVHLKHPFIIGFWGLYEDSDCLCIVLDLCAGGDVYRKLCQVERFAEGTAAAMALQMVSATDYLHRKSIMHRNIRAENFLIEDDSSTLKMIDFRCACDFTKSTFFNKCYGLMSYWAPELIKQRYTYQVDMWALGVLMYLLLYGQYPYRCHERMELYQEIISQEPTWIEQGVSQNGIDFIQLLLNIDPLKRAECGDVLQHPFIEMADPFPPTGPIDMDSNADVELRTSVKAGNLPSRRERRSRSAKEKRSRLWGGATPDPGQKGKPGSQEVAVLSSPMPSLPGIPDAVPNKLDQCASGVQADLAELLQWEAVGFRHE
eukprot:TRINITY_DN62878_c0_g1_i1.p1 TRINITY_DN62878_c0_g1~~TRINITY_DN62878_c0_g1_i1.p1  ORF type:complete len:419 (+),score=53.78 TRINITY_DN62878_c0_g1_i1:119-1375(+)